MKKEDINYSLYLVTDSTPEILGDKDICDVVEAALKGGVTIVQFRDKTKDTGELVRIARKLHGICQRYNVPLLINDRVDVALAVGCEGVHVGQDDMDYDDARRLLGPDAIIGVSAGTTEEATRASKAGADYLGIGAIYSTQTKKNTKRILGTQGVWHILKDLAAAGHRISAVGIGGIKLSNVEEVLRQSASPEFGLDGVAVVSGIMAAQDPEKAAKELLDRIGHTQSSRARSSRPNHSESATKSSTEPAEDLAAMYPKDVHFKDLTPAVLKAVKKAKPISHNMTNLVVQNFAANVALAVGASPIMANYGEEAADLAKLGGALVINMGTVTPEGLKNHLQALKAYNAAGRPVVLDPVGAGATAVRRSAAKTILSAGFLDVIKGNEGEIRTIYALTDDNTISNNPTEQQRGVDSSSTLSTQQKSDIVTRLAKRLKNVVVLTGKIDFVSNGDLTVAIDNGHELLGEVTGTGCVLGTTISAMVAAYPDDKLAAVVAGIYQFNLAAEGAATRDSVKGPGTFVPAFIDELARIREESAAGDYRWLQGAKAYRMVR